MSRTIALVADKCTSCMLCVRECPTWCIDLDAHHEQVSEEGARRPRTVAVLDAFTIEFGLCMLCGICVEACPFDALEWAPGPLPQRLAWTRSADHTPSSAPEVE